MAEYLDVLMFVAALILLLRGFPVAFTLAGVALAFAFLGAFFEVGYFTGDISFLKTYPNRIFGNYDETNEVLVAVPLFIFMGVMLERSNVAGELLETMGRLFGPLRGGLGLSVSFVGMLLAASTGIVGATVVTMGLISLPSMLKHNYSKHLACGSIAAAGTLGQIIPPSIVLVILGDQISNAYIDARRTVGDWAPEPVSVGDLFAGALIPGLILVSLYMTYQIGMAIFRPESSPSIQEEGQDPAEHKRAVLTVLSGFAACIVAASILPGQITMALVAIGLTVLLVLELIGLSPFAEDRRGFAAELVHALAPPVILIVAVLGSILVGIATPTEAAAVGAIGATLLAGSRVKCEADDTGDMVIITIVATILAMIFGRLSGAVDSQGAIAIGIGGAALLVLLQFARDKSTLILMSVIAMIVAMLVQQNYDLRLTRDSISATEQMMINVAWICLGLTALGVLAALIRVWRAGVLNNVMQATTKVTTMVFIILVGAGLFSLVFRGLGGEERVHEWLSNLPGGAFGAMLVVMLVMFVLGFFLDFLEIVFVVVPIVSPILFQLELPGGGHMSPVWVAVMMAINLQTSFLTPPFGFALFYLRGVAPKEVTTMDIYKGVAPFVLIQIIGLGIVAYFPILATWLPKVIFG